jgi:carbon storage regulator
MIGDGIKITVVSIRGGKVRIGIDAPGLPVHRQEVYEAIKKENENAKAK